MDELSLEEWLNALAAEAVASRASSAVLAAVARQPELASYSSAADLAAAANVNIASVTRTAQALSFAGWPAMREEIRDRYLTSLSMSEIADRHERNTGTSPLDRSLATDEQVLRRIATRIDKEALSAVVRAVAHARTRLIVAAGSYACVGQLLSINATLAGYPTYALPEGAATVNEIARVGPPDVVVAISMWRLYESTIAAATSAKTKGATVVVITDHQPSALTAAADYVLAVSAEGSAYFPNMVPAVALVNALCADLATIDPKHTKHSVATAEKEWDAQKILRHPPARSARGTQNGSHQ